MKAEYAIALVSYFDILGFKAIVQDKTSSAGEIRDILELLRKESHPDPEGFGSSETSIIAFSDTIVRTTHILSKKNTEYPTGMLFSELSDIAYAQIQMVFKNVIVRGVVTGGKIYHNDDIIFGEGLIKAYEMERDIAKYPRIIVDPEILDVHTRTPYLKSISHTHAQDMEYIKALIRRDCDGVWYVGYLEWYFDNVEEPLELLYHHKKLIIENINKYDEFCSEYVKYAWMAKYHNAFTREIDKAYFKEFECTKQDYIIEAKDMPFVYDEGI